MIESPAFSNRTEFQYAQLYFVIRIATQGTILHGEQRKSASRDARLWPAAWSTFSRRDTRTISFDHLADGHAGRNDSLGLRACGQRHMVRVHFGDLRRSARGAVRQPILPLLRLAWLALLLCIDDPAAVIRGHRRLEPAAGLRCHRIERHWRFLSLRQSFSARRNGTADDRSVARTSGHWNFDLDRLARRKNLRAADALDRGGLGIADPDCRRTGPHAERSAHRFASVAAAGHDWGRPAARVGTRPLQFRGF